MDPAAACAFMGFEGPCAVDAADAKKRFMELRKTPEYKENPEYKRQADAAYLAIKSKANAVFKRPSEVLEERMQAAGLSGDEQALVRLVNGDDEEHWRPIRGSHHRPRLWTGSCSSEGKPRRKMPPHCRGFNGIRHVLDMTNDLDDHTPALQTGWGAHTPGAECSYCNCPAEDTKDHEIGKHLDGAVEFIDACRVTGGGVLCTANRVSIGLGRQSLPT